MKCSKFEILTKIKKQYRLLQTDHCYNGEWRTAKTFEEAQSWAAWNKEKLGRAYTVVETIAIGGNLDYTVSINLMKLTNGKYATYIEMNWGNPDNPPQKTFVGPILADPDEAWKQAVEQSTQNGIEWI